MAQLNVTISDEAYRRAKVAAAQGPTLLRLWVEQAILDATEDTATQPQSTEPAANGRTTGETRYEPLD